MSPVEDRRDADMARARLEDLLNSAIRRLQQARMYHVHLLDHWQASTHTETVPELLRQIGELESQLVAYQERAADYPPEVFEDQEVA